MTIKIIGALFVFVSCGGFGFMIAHNAYKVITALRQLISALEFMECELNYRMTPLPQLCRLTAAVSDGCIREVFINLAEELERQNEPNVGNCISVVLHRHTDIPVLVRKQLSELGRSLGTLDLSGQTKIIKAVNAENCRLLENLSRDHNARFRSYKTLGLCAGAALVILFI